MRITRRRWLAAAAGTAASTLAPFAASAATAHAAATVPVSKDGAAQAAAGTLRLYFGAGAGSPALREAACSIVSSCGHSTLDKIDLPVLSLHERPRLDVLVEQLRPLRGSVLLGAVCARHAVCVDEALRELGAAWLYRGEHAMLGDGLSRHWLTVAGHGLQGVDLCRECGWSHMPMQEWQSLLGADMATRALMPQRPADEPAFIAAATRPPSIREAHGANAFARAESFLSFVTRL